MDGDTSVFQDLMVLACSKGKCLYNPGGPGPTPFPDARYTAPGPANQLFAVRIDLENEHQTTFCLNINAAWSRDVAQCEAWRANGELKAAPIGSFQNSGRVCPENLVELANAELSNLTASPSSTATATDEPTATGTYTDEPTTSPSSSADQAAKTTSVLRRLLGWQMAIHVATFIFCAA